MKNMAYRIRTARLQAGQSQAQLARETKLTQQMISKLESGQSRSTSAIFAIANALGVSAEWLWLGDEANPEVQMFKDAPLLLEAWLRLSMEQRDEISRQIIELSGPPSSAKASGNTP